MQSNACDWQRHSIILMVEQTFVRWNLKWKKDTYTRTTSNSHRNRSLATERLEVCQLLFDWHRESADLFGFVLHTLYNRIFARMRNIRSPIESTFPFESSHRMCAVGMNVGPATFSRYIASSKGKIMQLVVNIRCGTLSQFVLYIQRVWLANTQTRKRGKKIAEEKLATTASSGTRCRSVCVRAFII